MNKTNGAVFWGLFLTTAGAIALASTLGVIPSKLNLLYRAIRLGRKKLAPGL